MTSPHIHARENPLEEALLNAALDWTAAIRYERPLGELGGLGRAVYLAGRALHLYREAMFADWINSGKGCLPCEACGGEH